MSIESIIITAYLDNGDMYFSAFIEVSVMASNDLFNKMWFYEITNQNQKFLSKVFFLIPI